MILNGLPWKLTEIILLFLILYPTTAFWIFFFFFFFDYEGYSISAGGFLPTVVDTIII